MARLLRGALRHRGDGPLQRANYRGSVRDSEVEDARDDRMLALNEQGVANAVIAQRMGVTPASVRVRIARARQRRGASSTG